MSESLSEEKGTSNVSLGSKMKVVSPPVDKEAPRERFIPVEDMTSVAELASRLNDAEQRWATAHKQLFEEVERLRADHAKQSEDVEHLSNNLATIRQDLPKVVGSVGKIVLDDEVEAVLREEMALQSRELCAKLRSELQSEITARIGAAEKYAIDSFKKQFGAGVQNALNEVSLNIKKLQSSQAVSNSLAERVVNLERQLTDTTCLVTSLASRALEDSSNSAVKTITNAIQEESSKVSTHTKEAVELAIQGAFKGGSVDLPPGAQSTDRLSQTAGTDRSRLYAQFSPESHPRSLDGSLQNQPSFLTADALIESIQTIGQHRSESIQTIDKHRSETPNSRHQSQIMTPPRFAPRQTSHPVPFFFPSLSSPWTEVSPHGMLTHHSPRPSAGTSTTGRPASPTSRASHSPLPVQLTRQVARQISAPATMRASLVDTKRFSGGSMTLRVPKTPAPDGSPVPATPQPTIKVQAVRTHSPGSVRTHSPGNVRAVRSRSPQAHQALRTLSPISGQLPIQPTGASVSMPVASPGASVSLPVASPGASVSMSIQSAGASVQVTDAPSVGSSIKVVGASMVQVAAPEGSSIKAPTIQVLPDPSPDPSTESSLSPDPPSPAPPPPSLMQAPAPPSPPAPRAVQAVPTLSHIPVAGPSLAAGALVQTSPQTTPRVIQPVANVSPAHVPPPSPGSAFRVIHIGTKGSPLTNTRRLSR